MDKQFGKTSINAYYLKTDIRDAGEHTDQVIISMNREQLFELMRQLVSKAENAGSKYLVDISFTGVMQNG